MTRYSPGQKLVVLCVHVPCMSLHREIDDRISPTAELFLGTWKYPLKPSDYLARNVRATPGLKTECNVLPNILFSATSASLR